MSTLKDAVTKARGEVQSLHKRIEATTATNHAAIRSDLEATAEQARQLASSVKTLAEDQRADAKQHLKDAATQLEDAAKQAKAVGGASEADVKKANQAMLDRARLALQNISHAIAAARTTASKN